LGDVAIFLILQMALLWALAKAKASPHLYLPTLLLISIGTGIGSLSALRYESWLMLQ